MAFIGMAPFGSLIAGALAHTIGAQNILLLGGISCLTGARLLARNLPALREKVRPIYVKMGIVREVAAGMQAASQLTVPPEEQ